MYIEISIFRVHNVKRVCGQIYICNVNEGQIVGVSVPIRWWPLPIGYHLTLPTPPPPVLMLWAASTNDSGTDSQSCALCHHKLQMAYL
jgi:hypothetical protein